MQRWTDEKVRALKLPTEAREKRVLVEPGLYLFARTRTDGSLSKHWQYRAQVEGRRCWLSLGAFPAVGLASARAELLKHQAIHEAAKKGEADHPVLEARKARSEAKARLTVAEVFELWIQDKRLGSSRKGGEPVRQRTIDILTENFEADVAPTIGEFKVHRLTQQQIQSCIDRPRKRGAPGAAAQVYRTLRGLVNFSLKRQFLDGSDPMLGIDNPRPYRPAPVNAANDDELAIFLKVIRDSDIHPSAQLAIKLQLLTGARPSEVRNATWKEIELERCLWTIPADRVKTNKELKVHLSSTAVAALYNAKRGEVSPSDPVCPSKDGGHLSTMCVTRALKRITKRVSDEGGRALRPHDLRRTFRTLLSRLGIAPHIADLCMNHQEEKTMRRAYDGHDYFGEMRQAWECVGSHIDSLNCSGANVYPITKRIMA